MTAEERIQKAIELGFQFGGIDGAHHKAWLIDQMLRVLIGEPYDEIVRAYRNGDDGPDTYNWDVGIAP